ncbi:MAG: DUF1501 domain-containing protein [Verrucomicrobiales bacterium]|nr:DUF1501 domain-containing protein [Verrucomicrobiales bacterium]
MMMSVSELTRRHLLGRSLSGLGGMALASLLEGTSPAKPGMVGLPHHEPKAKRVICLFMSGGFSQFESFDYKPLLKKRQGEDLPKSVRAGHAVVGMSKNQAVLPLVGSKFEFKQHGESGAWCSSLFPHLAGVVDELAFVQSLKSDAVNHDPALTFLQTGAQLPGRPSMGAWLSYGLGSECEDLPAFIVLVSKRPVDQPLSSRLWDSGFLPTQHQGVQFRSGKEPVLYLNNPNGVPLEANARMLAALRSVQTAAHQLPEREISARIEQYEMACRMQTSVPEATNLSGEPDSVKKLYGEDVEKVGSFAANCLVARRLAERGVRFIQLFHPGWDHHGGLPEAFEMGAREVDQPCAALIQDLKQRDMLKDTLVLFVSEFGRTCYSQGRIAKSGSYGREHHRDCFTAWLAGGGVKRGQVFGSTDEFGYQVAENPVSVHDLHATMLHLLGIDHERFTFFFQGRDFRLTDVFGTVQRELLA